MDNGGLLMSPFGAAILNRGTRWETRKVAGKGAAGVPPLTRASSGPVTRKGSTRSLLLYKERGIGRSAASVTGKRMASVLSAKASVVPDSTALPSPKRSASSPNSQMKGVALRRTPSIDTKPKSFHSAVKAAQRKAGIQGGLVKKRMTEWATEGKTSALCKDMGRSLTVRK
ncbi:hypothetical protein T484DRAFT_1904051 [Baffinella frigidus]|nr:hypothetical protein T484DRAFT_1904051 [Cryptophyta sp. CCMP2293]|mmetsp:Transcript_33597/g.79536  ORF Transcript_33597/g.79536 Transcript_33597/m.79536 type:complete len:171 (+) Transcript_33597:182-694(+)|eukprot:CAMPEP_0180152086 /NCGR_PEP_ID=MMETSP0986-20121125/22556_1 /TAXON_ID=697907 /ORGANISM="non described non described, Strain CCMP2293" /LENGTH=170 /DNA_ID=CAMNT_0022099587 /DNA_START=166 /DNA_END=681 /DNA_ORIENTATION=+